MARRPNTKKTARKLRKRLDAAAMRVKIGVPDVTHEPSSMPLPELATIHEYGATISKGGSKIVIPERAPFRTTIEQNRRQYSRALEDATRLAVRKKDTRGYDAVGAKAASDVQRNIARGLPPGNADSTVAAKGSSTPLIDTGAFRQSITWAVEDPA